MQREREQLLGDMAATLRQYHGASSPSSQESPSCVVTKQSKDCNKKCGIYPHFSIYDRQFLIMKTL